MKRVLITVSGGVAHVDHVPEGVTVEVRDMDGDCDQDGETGRLTMLAYEHHASDGSDMAGVVAVQLIGDGRGAWWRKDGARPEFDGGFPQEEMAL